MSQQQQHGRKPQFNVEEELKKAEAELVLETTKLKRNEFVLSGMLRKSHAATFTGFTPSDIAKRDEATEAIPKNEARIKALKQLIMAMKEYRTSLMHYEDEEGNYIYDDEDAFDRMVYGNEDEEDENEEFFNEFEKKNEAATRKPTAATGEAEGEFDAAFEFVSKALVSAGIDPRRVNVDDDEEGVSSAKTTGTTVAGAGQGGSDIHHVGTLDEMQLLNLAKFGNFEHFRNIVAAHDAVSRLGEMTDNFGRNALHYAADCGCVPLINYLMKEGKLDPLQADTQRGLSPLAIAVILERTTATEAMLNYLRAKDVTVKPEWTNRTSLLYKFAPDPPKLLVSKAAPAVHRTNAPHTFWGSDPNANPPNPYAIIADMHSPTFKAEACVTFLNDDSNAPPNSIYSWLSPLSRLQIRRMPPGSFGIYTEACNVFAGVAALTGCSLVAGRQRPVVVKNPAIVDHVTVPVEFRHGVDASVVMNATRHGLMQRGHEAAIFATQGVGLQQLGLQPLGRIKWFRRVLNPRHILSCHHDIVNHVYPDFSKYTPTITVDLYLKSVFRGGPTPTLNWIDMKSEGVEKEYAPKILNFLQAAQPKVADVSLQYTTPEVLYSNLLNPTTSFVVMDDQGNVTDFVCLAQRSSRLLNECAVEAGSREPEASAAIHVFSLFTSPSLGTGEARLIELTKLAGKLEAEVFYSTNTHGFAAFDYKQAMFEEVTPYAQYLYALGANFGSVYPGPAPAEAKVFLPFALF